MTSNTTAKRQQKTLSDPNDAYTSMQPLWLRCRAVCSGERFVKEYDNTLDTHTFTNMLVPFSPSMTSQQYRFYKAEAELPGLVAQYSKFVIGGLLRKKPQLELPDGMDEDIKDWILDSFGQDGCSLASFLDQALQEKLPTSRAWIYVDYSKVKDPESLTKEQFLNYKPNPVL